MAARVFKLGLVQMRAGMDKAANLAKAADLIKEAAGNGCRLVSLPECFNSPYGAQYFGKYAENVPKGDTCKFLERLSKELNIHIVGGSIPEIEGEKLYNTCTVWSPSKGFVCKYQKIHLFDIDIPGKITFKESETLSAGSSPTMVDFGFCKVGLGICYDVRFTELSRLYGAMGCHLLLFPGAFNTVTGPLHWKLLAQARALDNQVYMAMVSPARDPEAGYQAWGHSLVVDPLGAVVSSCLEDEEIVYADLDLDKITEIRGQIPVSFQRRNDIYKTVAIVGVQNVTV